VKTDAQARVLDANGQPIEGLFAAGNDNASVMGGGYPGGGITIGPAMTFGFVAAEFMAGRWRRTQRQREGVATGSLDLRTLTAPARPSATATR
jgi:predicted oxidoreductase